MKILRFAAIAAVAITGLAAVPAAALGRHDNDRGHHWNHHRGHQVCHWYGHGRHRHRECHWVR